MEESWKLRGGICNAEHVRECFQWKERKDRHEFYKRLASILQQTEDGDCILSQLDEEEKKELRCSWIVRWAKTGENSRSTLVGKYFHKQ
jgi:hypothetical protein